MLQSTQVTLKILESLGPDYMLGRMAINEVEEFSLNKNTGFD